MKPSRWPAGRRGPWRHNSPRGPSQFNRPSVLQWRTQKKVSLGGQRNFRRFFFPLSLSSFSFQSFIIIIFFLHSYSLLFLFVKGGRGICFFRLLLFSKCLTAIYIFPASHRRPSWIWVRKWSKMVKWVTIFSLSLSLSSPLRVFQITEISESNANQLSPCPVARNDKMQISKNDLIQMKRKKNRFDLLTPTALFHAQELLGKFHFLLLLLFKFTIASKLQQKEIISTIEPWNIRPDWMQKERPISGHRK